MKKLLIISFLFALASLQAQNLEKSILWKISGNGLKNPSYLFGTIHISCDSLLTKKVQNALSNTQQVYLEINMSDPNLMVEMANSMMMKNGKTMNQLANPEDYKMVDTFLKEQTGYSLQLFNTMKPFFISAFFYPKMLDCQTQSLEQTIMKLGKENDEKIFGLETVEQQMDIFDAIPYQEQMNELIKSVKNKLVDDKEEMNQLMKLYKAEDLNGMLAATESSDNTIISKYMDKMLYSRNNNWIPKIKEAISQKPTFFAVESAHLAGEKGVIMLLRKQGYKVEAVLNSI